MPKKDVTSCEKPRGAASKHRAVDIRMGEPGLGRARSPADESIVSQEGTRGTETSKYPEEKKERSISVVAASEEGRGQTHDLRMMGVEGHQSEKEAELNTEGKRDQRR